MYNQYPLLEGHCRACQEELTPFMSFGQMPLANAFLSPDLLDQEYFYHLQATFCTKCFLFQIYEQPDPQKIFNSSYPFYTSSSKFMQVHFQKFAEDVITKHLSSKDSFIVEIGSNDGTMLSHFAEKKIRHLGIDPSQNVTSVAHRKGLTVSCDFFHRDLAHNIRNEQGPANVILAANVLCHIPDLHNALEGVTSLLKEDGVFIFEEPYLGDMLEKTAYDQIYDEHVFMFSLTSLEFVLSQHHLHIIDVIHQNTHGGSLRYIAAFKESHKTSSEAVMQQLAHEDTLQLKKLETYNQFRIKCEISRDNLTDVIQDLHKQGKRIVGYGATSKSTTVTNYCQLLPEHIEFISDTTPDKQGKLSPGSHIPIGTPQDFSNHYPDYALLFAWNHKKEILKKETAFTKRGGHWISYIPDVAIFS